MSNGHPKQRRGGAAHARHGPQRQERAAAPSGAPGATSAIGNGQANGQTTTPTTAPTNGASNGAKRPAKPNDNRVMLQPPQAPPASAAPTPNLAPGKRQKTAHDERSAPTPPTRPSLPVVRRRGGPVIVPPVSRAAPSHPGVATNQAPGGDGASASQQPAPAHIANQPPMGAFVISLAQRDLEVAIEATSVEMFSLEVERIDTIVEIDESSATDDRDGGTGASGASGASGDTPGANPAARRRAGAGAANGAPSGLAATTDAAASDDADTAPALPVAPAPRARLGHFYAPGGPMRPDESWVDRASGNAGNAADHGANAANTADHSASVAPPQSRYSGPGNPAPYTPYPIPEHVEHFDHSTRVGPRDDLGRLIDSLHGLFEQDRAVASQTGAARCGACYLHFALADLDYREQEGFYVCPACKRSLGAANIPMVRRQQR